MAAMMYAAFQDPRGAGLLFLVLGLFLIAVGLLFVFLQRGTLLWIVIGAGALMAGTGWLLRRGIG